MKKLFKLKNWLTISDTAKYLSTALEEDVTEVDVYRLCLDGHLKLSVELVHDTQARPGKIVGMTEVEYRDVPALDRKTMKADLENMVRIYSGIRLKNDEFVVHDKENVLIGAGTWNLPMIGEEYCAVLQEYRRLTDGPYVDYYGDGIYVEKGDGIVYQLQASYTSDNIAEETLTEMGNVKEKIPDDENFCPAGSLPEDSAFIVRTDEIERFEQSLSQKNNSQAIEENLPESERISLLKMALGMAIDAYDYNPKAKKNIATGNNSGSISNALAKHDLNLDADTIRKFIKEAEDKFL
jgi:hypothetical protein